MRTKKSQDRIRGVLILIVSILVVLMLTVSILEVFVMDDIVTNITSATTIVITMQSKNVPYRKKQPAAKALFGNEP